jgi:prepilin-type N-terminal cleavage/methylation domain-containing protein
MTKNKLKREKMRLTDGFTIIEVVLVLAIAGLIFLMVFIALPALQRSQRDTQRRDDLARASTALTQYMANNRSNAPTFTATSVANQWGTCTPPDPTTGATATGFCANYMLVGGDSFNDPDGNSYVFASGTSGLASDGSVQDANNALTAGETFTVDVDFEEAEHKIWVTYAAKCNGEIAEYTTGSRKVALQYKLEGGGVVCVNN